MKTIEINFNSLHHPFVWRKKCRLRKKRIEKFGKWLFLPKSALTDFRGTADMLPVTEQLLLVKGKSKTCRNRHQCWNSRQNINIWFFGITQNIQHISNRLLCCIFRSDMISSCDIKKATTYIEVKIKQMFSKLAFNVRMIRANIFEWDMMTKVVDWVCDYVIGKLHVDITGRDLLYSIENWYWMNKILKKINKKIFGWLVEIMDSVKYNVNQFSFASVPSITSEKSWFHGYFF